MSDTDPRPTHRPEARGLSVGLEDLEDLQADFAAALAAAAATLDGRPVPALGAL